MIAVPHLPEGQKRFCDETSNLVCERFREQQWITFKGAENQISQVGKVRVNLVGDGGNKRSNTIS